MGYFSFSLKVLLSLEIKDLETDYVLSCQHEKQKPHLSAEAQGWNTCLPCGKPQLQSLVLSRNKNKIPKSHKTLGALSRGATHKLYLSKKKRTRAKLKFTSLCFLKGDVYSVLGERVPYKHLPINVPQTPAVNGPASHTIHLKPLSTLCIKDALRHLGRTSYMSLYEDNQCIRQVICT